MPGTKLISAVKSIDWNANVDVFVADTAAVEKIAKANLRLAAWAKQFETIDKDNAALCFVREMQISGHLVAASTALAVYKSAASAMRAMLETALYYTYFRTHLPELSTLVKNSKYYISKTEVLEYHSLHTPDFQKLQSKISLVGRINPWYSSISAIVHGQIPGKWSHQRTFANLKHEKPLQDLVIETFCEGEEIVHRLFLCTVGRELWDYMTPTVKKLLIAGLPGDVRTEFGIDAA